MLHVHCLIELVQMWGCELSLGLVSECRELQKDGSSDCSAAGSPGNA